MRDHLFVSCMAIFTLRYFVHDCWQQCQGKVLRRPGSRQPRGSTEREDCRIRRMFVVHRTTLAAEIQQRIFSNWLLQG